MKKIFLISALLISGMISTAQEATPQKNGVAGPEKAKPVSVERRAANQTNDLDKVVTLSQEQKTKVLAINLNKNKLVEAAKAKAGENNSAFEIERKKINTDRRAEIAAILTTGQKELWTKSKKAE